MPDPTTAYPYLKPTVARDNEARAQALTEGDAPVVRPYLDGLVITYVFNLPDQLQFVQARDLEEHGVTADELHAAALNNLLNLAAAQLRVEPYESIFAVLLDGNFEASLILLDSIWDQSVAHLVPGGLALVAPARDVLGFADASSNDGIAGLTALVERLSDGEHLLPPVVYRRVDNSWQTTN